MQNQLVRKRSAKQMEKIVKEYRPFTCPKCDKQDTQNEVTYNYSEDQFSSSYKCSECGTVWSNIYNWSHTEIEVKA